MTKKWLVGRMKLWREEKYRRRTYMGQIQRQRLLGKNKIIIIMLLLVCFFYIFFFFGGGHRATRLENFLGWIYRAKSADHSTTSAYLFFCFHNIFFFLFFATTCNKNLRHNNTSFVYTLPRKQYTQLLFLDKITQLKRTILAD